MQYKIHIDLALFNSDLANESLNFNEKIPIWKKFVVFANKDASLSDLKLVICDTFIELYPDQGNIYIFGHLKDSSLADLSDRFKIEEVLDTAERKFIVFCTVGQVKRKLGSSYSTSNVIVNGQMTESEESKLKRKKSLSNEASDQHAMTSSEQNFQISPLKVCKEIENKDTIDQQLKNVEKNANPIKVFSKSSNSIPNIKSPVKLMNNRTEMLIDSIPPETVQSNVFPGIKKTSETIESSNIDGSNLNTSEVAINIAESSANLEILNKSVKKISTFENLTIPKEPFQSTYKIEMCNGSQISSDSINSTEISKTSNCNLVYKVVSETSGHNKEPNASIVKESSSVSDGHYKRTNNSKNQKNSSGSKNPSIHSSTKDFDLAHKDLSSSVILKQTQPSENELQKPQDESRSSNQKQLFTQSNETNQNIIKTVSTKKPSLSCKPGELVIEDRNDSVTKFPLNQSLENSSNSSSIATNLSPLKETFKLASSSTEDLLVDKKSLKDDLSISNKSSTGTFTKKRPIQKSQLPSKDLSLQNTLSPISTNFSSVSLTSSISDISLKPSAPYPSVKEILLPKKSAIRKSVPMTKAQEAIAIATQTKSIASETFDESSSESEETSSSKSSSLIYSSKLFK